VIQLASSEQRSATAFPTSAGADRVYGDSSPSQRDGEIASQHFHRRFRCSRRYPRLPASKLSPGRKRNGNDPATLAHQPRCLADAHQEGFGLRIHGGYRKKINQTSDDASELIAS
jgi:hypothetical protein